MRLIRFGPKGMERPGIEIEDRIVDLRRYFPDIPDIGDAFFRNGWLDKVAGLEATGEPMTERRGCPLDRPSKIICLGKNYAEHAKEGGFDQPDKPLLFCKGSNALNGPYDPILLPRSCGKIDWEVELAVVIGREAKRVRKADARDVMAGVTIMNDVSGREAQFADSQWFRGKSYDTFAPLGPAIVTMEEIGDIQNLRLTAVGGRHRHAGRQQPGHDLRRRHPDRIHQRGHDPLPGRRDFNRYTERGGVLSTPARRAEGRHRRGVPDRKDRRHRQPRRRPVAGLRAHSLRLLRFH